MPTSSFVSNDITTINYTLEWPHLEDPSNTTFTGHTQIDICKCGPNNIDLGHIYTRYRCPRPEIRFATPDDELWVLQAPLGQVNLLRPADSEELQRRRDVDEVADPTAYAGKNFLLLTGPCPRGRYQAYATLQFLKKLAPLARQHIECLSLLIQPYEEDCSDDQGGRAYVELARYILEELPAFKTLCLNIWGEEARIGSREFAMVLWKEGVRIVVSWDWWSGQTEDYTDVEAFLDGIEEGVVAERPIWEDVEGNHGNEYQEGHGDGAGRNETRFVTTLISRSSSRETSVHRGPERSSIIWQEISTGEDDDDEDRPSKHVVNEKGETEDDHDHEVGGEPTLSAEQGGLDTEQEPTADAQTPTFEQASSEDDWSDTMLTPLSPHGGDSNEDSSWHVL